MVIDLFFQAAERLKLSTTYKSNANYRLSSCFLGNVWECLWQLSLAFINNEFITRYKRARRSSLRLLFGIYCGKQFIFHDVAHHLCCCSCTLIIFRLRRIFSERRRFEFWLNRFFFSESFICKQMQLCNCMMVLLF